jgi:hypothetical protein
MVDTQASQAPAATGAAAALPKPGDLTARVAVYPSPMIRPVPSFMFSVPRGWVLDESPDALVVVRTPQEVEGFWVNAILSHDRVARSVDFKEAAQATWARIARSSPEAVVQMERLARFGTNVVYLRGIDMPAPKSGRQLSQLQALFFAPAEGEGKTVDMFQLVATSPTEVMDRFAPPFMEIIGSFRFT